MNEPNLIWSLPRKLLSRGTGDGRWMGPALLGTSLVAVSIVAVGACQEVAVLKERTVHLQRLQADAVRLAELNDALHAAASRCERLQGLPLVKTLPPPSGSRVWAEDPAAAPLGPTRPAKEPEPEPTPVEVAKARCQGAGAITRPVNDSLVDGVFEAQVTYKGPGKHLWLAVHHSGRYWPKEPRIEPTRTGEWIGDIAEDGYPPGLKFELVLLEVSAAYNDKFEAWFDRGHRMHSYPGFDANTIGTEDLCVVDSKKLHLVGASKR